MNVQVVRAGRHIEIQFTGAEIIETWGPRDELYGDGTITLTPSRVSDDPPER